LKGHGSAEMGFLDHLEDLRRTLLAIFAAVFIGALGAYVFSEQVIDFVVVRHVGQAQFFRPMEAFLARVKISLLLGLIVSLPFVAFQIWNFVVPGLLEQEKKFVLPLVFFSTLLFLVGTSFSYLVLTPVMVKLLVGFGTAHVKANIAVDPLLDFIIKLALACGILFQLPLVVALLTIVRIVTAKFLWSKWRHAIVIILIVAAVATPGDGPSQLVLAAPIIVLYFVSILISLGIERSRSREDEDEDEDGSEDDRADGASEAMRLDSDSDSDSELTGGDDGETKS
jgi:sec-independent protein translocase protein TatC